MQCGRHPGARLVRDHLEDALGWPNVLKEASCFFPIDNERMGRIRADQIAERLGTQIPSLGGEPFAVGLGNRHCPMHLDEPMRIHLGGDRPQQPVDERSHDLGRHSRGESPIHEIGHCGLECRELASSQQFQRADVLEAGASAVQLIHARHLNVERSKLAFVIHVKDGCSEDDQRACTLAVPRDQGLNRPVVAAQRARNAKRRMRIATRGLQYNHCLLAALA